MTEFYRNTNFNDETEIAELDKLQWTCADQLIFFSRRIPSKSERVLWWDNQVIRFLEERQCNVELEGWALDCGNSNIFLKPLFRGNLDPFVNNANLGAIAHTSNGT